MLSQDLETLIASKKREILQEKILLGIVPPPENPKDENKENAPQQTKSVSFNKQPSIEYEKDNNYRKTLYQLEENIPLELERYIRRYCGLPVMLKAGEYSPNNPLLRAERASGDALLGLGEYERRRNTLRKIRQAQYRQYLDQRYCNHLEMLRAGQYLAVLGLKEYKRRNTRRKIRQAQYRQYLDQQAKKKQDAKEQAERERREREEKEKEREERERQLLLEREKNSPERRASVCGSSVANVSPVTKVDSAVQVDGVSRPLSVAVQTDDAELYRLSPAPACKLTLAERELSPRAVQDLPATWENRRRSTGEHDERTPKKTNREKLVSDLRHSYRPSIFDAEHIQQRNVMAEKEAAERRKCYQQELRSQILEQQRIREERQSREKMLEAAEMRRLEEQLRMLRVAQEKEIIIQHDAAHAMKDNATEFETKRAELQREIDTEQKKLIRPLATSRNNRYPTSKSDYSTKSDNYPSKLPFFYPSDKTFQPIDKNKKPYSFNIPENSVFSENYDVDSYLRKNLNFRDKIDLEIENIGNTKNNPPKSIESHEKHVVIEKALVHEPKERRNSRNDIDNLSIPVLRHSPKSKEVAIENSAKLSEAMLKIEDKWKVPAVQKNILKTLPNENGKNVNILTQLGSIRRQLQLEQLKLDQMLTKNDS